jgi:ribonuclease Y
MPRGAFMIVSITSGIISVFAGVLLGLAAYKFLYARILRHAKEDAEEILDEVREAIELKNLEEKERIQEIEMEMWTKIESEMLKSETRIEELQELATEKKSKADAIVSDEKKKLQEKENEIVDQEQSAKINENKIGKMKDQQKGLNDELIKKLTSKLSISAEEFKSQIKAQIEEDSRRRALKLTQQHEEDFKEHAETRAKKILSLIIDRFARPYCAERGIGAVNFPDAHVRKLFCDPKGANIKAIQ